VSGADQRPFGSGFFDAVQKKLSKPSRLFDLPDNRFDDLPAQAIAARGSGALRFRANAGVPGNLDWFADGIGPGCVDQRTKAACHRGGC
jgi:hypothetical protein